MSTYVELSILPLPVLQYPRVYLPSLNPTKRRQLTLTAPLTVTINACMPPVCRSEKDTNRQSWGEANHDQSTTHRATGGIDNPKDIPFSLWNWIHTYKNPRRPTESQILKFFGRHPIMIMALAVMQVSLFCQTVRKDNNNRKRSEHTELRIVFSHRQRTTAYKSLSR